MLPKIHLCWKQWRKAPSVNIMAEAFRFQQKVSFAA